MDKCPEIFGAGIKILAMKALANQTRLRLFEFFQEPQTVTMAGKKFGLKRTSIYYHLKVLEKAGLIEKAGEHKVRNLTESYYRARNKTDFVPWEMFGEQSSVYIHNLIKAIAASTCEDCLKALPFGEERKAFGSRFFIRLRKDSLDSISEQISKMSKEFEKRIKELSQEDGELSYSVTIVHFEMPDK